MSLSAIGHPRRANSPGWTSVTFLKVIGYGLSMVALRIQDEENYLCFTEGYLPDIQHMEKVYPRSLRRERETRFSSSEEGAAWLFSTFARSKSMYHGCPEEIAAKFHTWILGKPVSAESTRLTPWFENLSQSSAPYRLAIHYEPIYKWPDGGNFRHYWSDAGRRLGLKHRVGSWKALLPDTREYLMRIPVNLIGRSEGK